MVVPGAALAQQVPGLFDANAAPSLSLQAGSQQAMPPSSSLPAGNLQATPASPALQAGEPQSALSPQHADAARAGDPAPPQILFQNAPPLVEQTATPSAVTIPAGTRVLMVLKSPLHTTSGTAGSGIYLETLYPVIQGNKVVIPAHTFVEGTVEGSRRPGHFRRTSGFRFRFTTLVFANNYVAPIQGVLGGIPGAANVRTSGEQGDLETVDQAEKVVTPTAIGAVGGAIIGSERRVGIGKFTGAGLGAALGLGAVLLHRGDEISLAKGTNVEMVLQAPLTLEAAQAAANAKYVAPPSTAIEAGQPQSDRTPQKRRRQYSPGLAGVLLGGFLR